MQKQYPDWLALPRLLYAWLLVSLIMLLLLQRLRSPTMLLLHLTPLCLVLHSPTNIICIALLLVFLKQRLFADFCPLATILTARAAFFYLGNSGSLATIKVGAGYTGVGAYSPGVVTTLLAVHTYSGPLLVYAHYAAWSATASGLRSPCRQDMQRCRVEDDSSPEEHGRRHVESDRRLKELESRPLGGNERREDVGAAESLATYYFYVMGGQVIVMSLLCTGMRFHLFVWTVFSPKLLYLGMELVVTTTFLVVFALLQENEKGGTCLKIMKGK